MVSILVVSQILPWFHSVHEAPSEGLAPISEILSQGSPCIKLFALHAARWVGVKGPKRKLVCLRGRSDSSLL